MICKQRSNICNHKPSQPLKERLTMTNYKNMKTTRRRNKTTYDRKLLHIK